MHDKFGVSWDAYTYSNLGQDREGFSFVDSRVLSFLALLVATIIYPFIWLFNKTANGVVIKVVLFSNWGVRRCEILETPPKWEVWLEVILSRILYPTVFIFVYSIVAFDYCIKFVKWLLKK